MTRTEGLKKMKLGDLVDELRRSGKTFRDVEAYLQTGLGLFRITGMRRDYWVITGERSWCCCPDDTVYVRGDE